MVAGRLTHREGSILSILIGCYHYFSAYKGLYNEINRPEIAWTSSYHLAKSLIAFITAIFGLWCGGRVIIDSDEKEDKVKPKTS